MPDIPSNDQSFRQRCLSLFTGGHLALFLALITSVGGLTAYIANFQSNVATNSRAISDMERRLAKLEDRENWVIDYANGTSSLVSENKRAMQDLENAVKAYISQNDVLWAEEHRYDQEVRTTIRDNEQSLHDALRHMDDRVNGIVALPKMPKSGT